MAEYANATKQPRKGIKRSDCERDERTVKNVPIPFVLADSLLLDLEVVKFKLKDTSEKGDLKRKVNINKNRNYKIVTIKTSRDNKNVKTFED